MPNSLFFRRLLGFILIAAVTLLTVVVVRYFSNSPLRENRPTVHSNAVDVSLQSIHFIETDASARKWQLFAASGEYDKVSDKSSLKDIRFVIERDGKGGPVTLTARHGEYSHASKNVNLQGNVLARTEEGTSLETPEVMYSSRSRILSGKERVKIDDAALTVEGTGFDFDIDSRNARIHNDVTATIYPGKRKK
jgi:LPS export ABC transporter protein LptC